MWTGPAQIVGLLLYIVDWGLVGCTLGMDRWRVAQPGGRGGSSVVATAWYWSDLWRDCYEDSTAVVNCVDFGVLWTVKPYVQAARGLLLTGLVLGLVGTVLTFFGMDCTRIGGDAKTKHGTLLAACAFQLVGCVSAMAAYCLYISTVAAAILHSRADPSELSYELGPPLYVGLVGSVLVLLGCGIQCAAARSAKQPNRRDGRRTGGSEKLDVDAKRWRATSYRMASVVVV
ncbi:claudin-10-like isoform X2 [Salarias fasciatus]|uniref:claudin-10-like isoform X2 n=1 Tax=Salarias fasciatus TaxID=181472 RepID=UPI0011764C3B|nr:claudin-10-like isoform X2 [Salarias fasciatus]